MKSVFRLSKEISRNLLFALNTSTTLFVLTLLHRSATGSPLKSFNREMFLKQHYYDTSACCAEVRFTACVAFFCCSASLASGDLKRYYAVK